MADSNTAPFGTWPSPITSDLIAAGSISLIDVLLSDGDVYWIEGRPQEGGRYVVVRSDGAKGVDLLPAPYSARTRVHEYGGGAVSIEDGTVFFSNFTNQQLCRLDADTVKSLTPSSPSGNAELRYADGVIDRRNVWIGVREDHRDESRVTNTIVAVNTNTGGVGAVLVQGNDFYSSPRLSPDGKRLAWLTWNHPQMPWVGSELWVGDFNGKKVASPKKIAGGPDESIFQPEWSPDGRLYFVSDRSGWWNLYRRKESGDIARVCELEAEFGQPQWNFGMATYAFISAREVVCTYVEQGDGKLARLNTETGKLSPFDLPFTEFSSIRCDGKKVAFKAGAATIPTSIVALDLSSDKYQILRKSTDVADDPTIQSTLSKPETIPIPTGDGESAFGLFYLPHNPAFTAPSGELPPLVVKCHGGPTASASGALDLRIQFWTSRGFAVVDVNYRGSSGYGRVYRNRLQGQWGIVDAVDCAAAARHLEEQGRVDGQRVVITGGSAGGYTTLRCLTYEDPAVREAFQAGGSHYGVSDPEALARDTHKFESHYLDWLIAPYNDSDPDVQEANRKIYHDRAPVASADRLSVPVAFFQGAEDKIVPPNQTELMIAKLGQKGITGQYLLFAGEQHGFRQSQNIKWALDAELYFFQRVVVKSASDSAPARQVSPAVEIVRQPSAEAVKNSPPFQLFKAKFKPLSIDGEVLYVERGEPMATGGDHLVDEDELLHRFLHSRVAAQPETESTRSGLVTNGFDPTSPDDDPKETANMDTAVLSNVLKKFSASLNDVIAAVDGTTGAATAKPSYAPAAKADFSLATSFLSKDNSLKLRPDLTARLQSTLKTIQVDGTDYYIVEGDTLLDEDQLRIYANSREAADDAFKAANLAEKVGLGVISLSAGITGPKSLRGGLLGMTQNGQIVRWSANTILTYRVIKSTFQSDERYDLAVDCMRRATKAWQDTCDVRFEHRADLDTAAGVGAAGAVFTVREIDAQGSFIASAFFPNDPASRRRVLLDPSFYADNLGFDRVGVLRHELGHVLGFRHEHIRSGAPPICPNEDTDQTIDLTQYDPQSVMHYFCGEVNRGDLKITELDKVGAQLVYGAPRAGFMFVNP